MITDTVNLEDKYHNILFSYTCEDNSVKKTLEKAVKTNTNLFGLFLTSECLININFSNFDLSGTSFFGCFFKDCIFANCNLDENTNFKGSDFENCVFSNCNLQFLGLFGTYFLNTEFIDSTFSSSNFPTRLCYETCSFKYIYVDGEKQKLPPKNVVNQIIIFDTFVKIDYMSFKITDTGIDVLGRLNSNNLKIYTNQDVPLLEQVNQKAIKRYKQVNGILPIGFLNKNLEILDCQVSNFSTDYYNVEFKYPSGLIDNAVFYKEELKFL